MKEIDFSKYKFRASQVSKIMTGTIGVTPVQDARIAELIQERETGINCNGNKIKFTANKEKELAKLISEKENPTLPKTMISELRKIYRSEKHNRNFLFTSKFIQKGILQENESITTYQIYRNMKGLRTFFVKNEVRLYDDYFQGEPDLNPVTQTIDGEKVKIGFDVKSSWSLDTFPFAEDELIDAYEYQNQIYMRLTGSDMWITCFALVNCTEQLLHNEKMKHYYAMGAPSEDSDIYSEYVKTCRDIEKMLVFDYDRFVDVYPYHQMFYTREEWMEEGNDIHLEDRILEKVSYRDDKKVAEAIERAKIGRKYLMELQKQDEQKLTQITR